jgi:hypothetical protein
LAWRFLVADLDPRVLIIKPEKHKDGPLRACGELLLADISQLVNYFLEPFNLID